MIRADFAYDIPSNQADIPLTLSIHADRPHVREQMREDAESARFRVIECGSLGALLEGEARALGEIVMLDCPQLDAAGMAALCRLDIRASRSGARLIVSTSLDVLDEVFACLDSSEPDILVDPGRADRVIALGQALARRSDGRVRELSEEDRMTLLRLTEQVSRIAERLGRLDGPSEPAAGSALRLVSPSVSGGSDSSDPSRLVQLFTPSLPDPRLVRQIIRQRQLRSRFFDGDLFADPAWDILLDLTAARVENVRVSVTSLCIASGVPPTTALRWIGQMTDAGLLVRVEDKTDRRRAFIDLTQQAADGMARYFGELGEAPLPI
ncbi:MAG: MarR family transcriptional regulator [Novosphingobium sp.]